MNRVAAWVMGMLLVGTLATAQTEVSSVNAVGFIRTSIAPGGWAIISIPFNRLDGLQTYTLPMLLPSAATGAKAWYYRDGGWKAESFVAFPPPAHWSPGTNEFIRGDALFVNAPGVALDLTVMGEVPDNRTAPTTTVVVISGWTLVGFSYPVDMAITNTDLAVKALVGDKIWWWDANKVGGAAWVAASYVAFPPPAHWNPATTILKAGQGYFYSRGGAQFDWEQVKPYANP